MRDVFDYVRRFQHELRTYFDTSKRYAEDQRVEWLLETLERHERFIEQGLARYEKKGEEAVLDTWLQYVPEVSLAQVLEEARLTPDMSLDEVIGCVFKWDQAILALYRTLASSTAAPQVQELFESLVKMEEAKETELSRGLLDEFQYGPQDDGEPKSGEAR